MSNIQVWQGCAFPDDLLYDVEQNVWVRREGGSVVVGMTDVAQTLGGRVVALTWKRPGKMLSRGRPIAVVESAKWVGPFPAPLSGLLEAVNREAFEADIAVANRDPYGAGWMARLQPTQWDQESPVLVEADIAFERYRAVIDAQQIRCYRCTQ